MLDKDKDVLMTNLISQNFNIEKAYNIDEEVLTYEQVDFLVYNLPALNAILDGVVNYIFASEIQFKKKSGEVLEADETERILSEKNINGIDIRTLLQSITRELFEHGAVGIRKVGNSFVAVKKNSYDLILKESDEHRFIYLPYLYLIRKEKMLNRKIRIFSKDEEVRDRRFSLDENGNIVSNTKNWIVLENDEFINLTLDDSIIGLSPFEYDKKRVHLTLLLLDYFIHDFKRNGVGTLMFKYKQSVMSQLANEIASTSGKIFDTSTTNQEYTEEKTKREIQNLVNQLTTVSYGDAVIYTDAFDEAEQLKRDSKPSDYLETLHIWIIRFISQIYGISPQVFDLVESSGNNGKDEIIKTFVLHWVIPKRNMLADKFTRIFQMLGYEYTVAFKNEEIADYYDYEDDLKVLDVYERLKSLGLDDKAEQYLNNNFIR